MKVELPFLAEGIEGGDVVHILVREGDRISEGQSVIELETDKATVPVPSPVAGTISRLLVRDGDHVKVGAVLMELDDAQGSERNALSSAPAQSPVPSTSQTSSPVEDAHANEREQQEKLVAKPPPTGESDRTQSSAESTKVEADQKRSQSGMIAAAPSVRRLARELDVDLSQVKGSETGGRITAEDVKTFVREQTGQSSAPSSAGGSEPGTLVNTMYGNERREPLSSLRRKIASNMTQSWTTIPHVHQFQDADITSLMALHKRYVPEFKKRGAILTLTSLVIKAVVHALKRYPQLNATLDLSGGEIIYKHYYNIGVAVDTPAGLIVPVVHDVDHKDLFQIAMELADLAERTRKREVKLEELRGATFSVSNMGSLGAGPFTPIISPPQVGILGIGKAHTMPVYREGQLVPRQILRLCVAYDHRVVDGAVGARFTNELAKVLEDFQGMFLGL